MTQEQVTPENSTAQPAPAKPEGEALLPDGIGLSLEQAQALIVKSNGIVLANNEPALMGITICNAFLRRIFWNKSKSILLVNERVLHLSIYILINITCNCII